MVNRIKIASLVFGVLLVSMIGSSLWMNYRAQTALQRSATRQLCHDVERQAVNLAYFFTERKDDLKDLAASRELSVFFENKALGMSMAYGLRASLLTIAQRLEHVVATKRFYDAPIYTRLLFLDATGEVLVDIDPAGRSAERYGSWSRFMTPDTREIFILEADAESDFVPIISTGYFFKGNYAGQLIAVLAEEIIFDHLLKPETADSSRRLGLVSPHGWYHDRQLASVRFPASAIGNHENASLTRIGSGESTVAAFFEEPFLAARVPVSGTPFSTVIMTPEAALFGNTSPLFLPLIIGVVAVVIIAGMGVLWQLNTRNTVLHTRLEETAKRERAIKKYQEELERLVEARTRDLKAAQNRLVNRAMEAGREQLSAMVLHNIGNAMTPLGVFMASLRENNVDRHIGYLTKCHAELKAHENDLAQFLRQNARGRDVFDFMGKLIADLEVAFQHNRQTETKINESIGYISEIISMQQAYAASSHEVKRRTDLNDLVDDAIRMQIGALEKRDIRVETSLQPSLPPLIIDKTRLMQVLVNIIKNGYEAMDQVDGAPREKRMHFSTYAADGRIGLAVKDTGIGVHPDMSEKLFDMGHSGKGSSGFGLYYCKMFAETNGGRLSIESDGVGRGAVVRIEFLRTASNEKARSALEHASGGDAAGETPLVASVPPAVSSAADAQNQGQGGRQHEIRGINAAPAPSMEH